VTGAEGVEQAIPMNRSRRDGDVALSNRHAERHLLFRTFPDGGFPRQRRGTDRLIRAPVRDRFTSTQLGHRAVAGQEMMRNSCTWDFLHVRDPRGAFGMRNASILLHAATRSSGR
jgi:hypothetical protein